MVETTTEERTGKKWVIARSVTYIAGLLLLIIILGYLFLLSVSMMFPNLPHLTVAVVIEKRIVLDSEGYYDYLLTCRFENDTEILLVLRYDRLSKHDNAKDYYSLVSVEIGEQWLYTLRVELDYGVYYVIDLVQINDLYNTDKA